jgi:flagellar biogenesis protein FliO
MHTRAGASQMEAHTSMDILADLIVVIIFIVFFAACWGLVKFLDRV